jgi:[ribosomal protein S18]-alanine N-acetyltransferase
MKLRFASGEDATALEAVHARAFDSSWTAADIERLMQIMGGYALLAEEAEKGPVGFILARTMAGEAEILTLAVAPWARRRGVARALIEAAAGEATRRGAGAMFLEVAADNPAARGLYGATGFAEAGLRRAYYARSGGPSADALVLRRALNTPSR